jgi:TetR/AcrR family transcriptional regulator, transcriptional repressor for nem operon
MAVGLSTLWAQRLIIDTGRKLLLDVNRMNVPLYAVSRAKEFDEAKVLDQAVGIFHARGFRQTSFADLTNELGVCRQSLYNTYGDKDTLFRASLKRYRERGLRRMSGILAEPGPIRPLLERLFETVISGTCSNGSPGCFMTNSMVEMAPQNNAIRTMAAAHAREVEAMFAARLAKAQRSGDLSKGKDTNALACYFFHTMLGLAVAARALGERDSLLATARLALLALD